MALQNKNDKIITSAIVLLSVIGIIYFGWQALTDLNDKNQDNPFEYNIETFKEEGANQVAYREIKTISLEMESPYAITMDDFDNCYIAGNKQIIGFDSLGNKSQRWSISDQATCLASDGSNKLYIGMLNKVEVINSDGVKIGEWNEFGEKAILTSIVVAKDYIYVADAGQLVVWQLDKTGKILNRIGEKNEQKEIDGFVIPSPYFDVAIDPDGYLWAVNTGMHQFENYYPDGVMRTSWARPSMRIDGFSGCCNPSHIAILADGSFVTSEKGLVRVKIHNQIGDFVSLVATPEMFDEGTVGLDLAVDSRGRIYVLDPKRKEVRIFQEKEDV